MQLVIFVLLKGHCHLSPGNDIGKDIPTFLNVVSLMVCSPMELSQRCAIFGLVKLFGDWLKKTPYHGFRNRFSLGTTGYSLPSASRSEKVHSRKTHSEPSYWNMLSTTRPTELIRLGSINAAILTLITEVYTKEDFQKMKDDGVIASFVEETRGQKLFKFIFGLSLSCTSILRDHTLSRAINEIFERITHEYFSIPLIYLLVTGPIIF